LRRFERLARFLQIDPRGIVKEVKATIARALEIWPDAAPALLGPQWGQDILARMETLQLVQEARD